MRNLLLLFVCLLSSVTGWGKTATLQLKLATGRNSVLTAYLPDASVATGRAVVDCPGGGYTILATDHEGHDWADYFNHQGIAYFVLEYNMPHGDRNVPLTDVRQALRTVRDSASTWRINPADVGIMGFSAGGHLAAMASCLLSYADRPNFSILFYPVITMKRGTHVSSREQLLGSLKDDAAMQELYSMETRVRVHSTPPAIILLANDDDAVNPIYNGIAYYSAMRREGNDCSLYVYPGGSHGFGFWSSFGYHDQMLNDLTSWLHHLKSPRPDAIRVACIGNSITEGMALSMASHTSYPSVLQQLLGSQYHVGNFGILARTLLRKGNLPYVNEPLWRDAREFQPNVVVLKLGTNDTKPENWQYGQDFASDLQAMVDTLKALPTHPTIYLCTPIPIFKPTWNMSDSVLVNSIIPTIRKVAKKNKCKVIDLHTGFSPYGHLVIQDGVHPNERGAKKLAELVATELKKH